MGVLAAECGISNGLEAKIVWNKLRCSYREAMRRRSIDKSLPAWKYEEQMSFLAQPYQAEAVYDISKYSENMENKCESEEDNIAIIKLENDIAVLNDRESPQYDTEVSFSKVDSSNDSNIKEQMREVEKIMNDRFNAHSPPTRLREQLRDDREKQRRETRSTIYDCNRAVSETGHNDGLTNLFASLCQKTRQLPKYLQLVVQREIFEAVIRAEEEALTNDSEKRSLDGANK
ncbi:hypothetical protein ACJJTC_011809 [Scirpophaga incertulas]